MWPWQGHGIILYVGNQHITKEDSGEHFSLFPYNPAENLLLLLFVLLLRTLLLLDVAVESCTQQKNFWLVRSTNHQGCCLVYVPESRTVTLCIPVFLKLPLANQNSWNIFCDCLHFSSQHNIDYWHLSVSKTICSRQQKSFFLSLTQFTDEFTTLMMTTPQISGEKAQQQQLLLWGSRNPNYNLLPSVQNQRHSNCFSHYGYCMLGGQTETTCKNSLDFCCLVICSISPVLKGLDG